MRGAGGQRSHTQRQTREEQGGTGTDAQTGEAGWQGEVVNARAHRAARTLPRRLIRARDRSVPNKHVLFRHGGCAASLQRSAGNVWKGGQKHARRAGAQRIKGGRTSGGSVEMDFRSFSSRRSATECAFDDPPSAISLRGSAGSGKDNSGVNALGLTFTSAPASGRQNAFPSDAGGGSAR